jgi:hypothetical protein
LAECVFAVTLTKRAAVLDGHADEEMERITPEDRHKFIRLGPDPVFMVTQNNDAGLGTVWKQIFIPLDCEDTHCGNGLRGAFFTECTILAKGDFAVGVEGFKATLFYSITLKPDLAIGMRVSKSL